MFELLEGLEGTSTEKINELAERARKADGKIGAAVGLALGFPGVGSQVREFLALPPEEMDTYLEHVALLAHALKSDEGAEDANQG